MTDKRHEAVQPFSRPVDVDEVPDVGLALRIEATPEECAAIAKQSGLAALGALVVDYEIGPRSHGRYAVRGKLMARMTQICVVSLEPFVSEKTQDIDLTFAAVAAPVTEQARSRRRRGREPEPPPKPLPILGDEDDPPDPIVDGTIDLGAVALEFLTLAQDLYPRKPGVQFTEMASGDETEEAASAFAALERLKDRL